MVDRNLLEPDYGRGMVTVRVRRPDGRVDDLGTHRLRSWIPGGATTLAPALDYDFDAYGRYEVRMTGEMFDRYGNRYAAGGTYEVWVAVPITFTTGFKPGTPAVVGRAIPTAATLNPPLPADVTATVRFYPGTDPAAVREVVQTGRAQRFGYFAPDASQPVALSDVPGEYFVDLFATHTDERGVVYMGNLRNAAPVLPEARDRTLVVRGMPDAYRIRTDRERAGILDGGYLHGENQGVFLAPEHSGETLFFNGAGHYLQAIHLAAHVAEPTGRLARMLRAEFPPAIIRITQDPAHAGRVFDSWSRFPVGALPLRTYAKTLDRTDYLPLLSTTDRGYSPFEYPERVNRRGYYYLSTVRPGFPVFFTVADSTTYDNYWHTNLIADYFRTLGAPGKGDQPGDVYWTVMSALYADAVAGTADYGTYGSGGAALPLGDYAARDARPFAAPIARINGVDLRIYAGAGPAPGVLYETGAIKGVGSIAVPMAPHDVAIAIRRPDGGVLECRGRADDLGVFACPNGPLVVDVPGVYRVQTAFSENGRTGTTVGSRAGAYNVYAVAKDSPFAVRFDASMPRRVDGDRELPVTGAVTPILRAGTAFYSVVAPGILLDEGEVPLERGRFAFHVLPAELNAEFPNVHDETPSDAVVTPHRAGLSALAGFVGELVYGRPRPKLSDTIEVVVFAQGTDDAGKPATAGAKFVLRGDRVIIPPAFRPAGEGRP
jgi:hypothetical protein